MQSYINRMVYLADYRLCVLLNMSNLAKVVIEMYISLI